MDWLTRLETPQVALSVLTAMITPAVLISACGALIFSTSTRLGRVIDRTRALSERFQHLAAHPDQDELFEENRQLIFTQLDRQTSRARLIQRAMAAYYTALGTFVASTVAIAIFSAAARNFTWIAVLLGVIGTLYMLYGSVLLIVESRMALSAIMTEMDFVWKLSQRHAGDDLKTKPGGPFTWLGRKIQ
jgi:threonine/homoserine/homoserine lactone efflux protein